jgi:hypothetical protein
MCNFFNACMAPMIVRWLLYTVLWLCVGAGSPLKAGVFLGRFCLWEIYPSSPLVV